MNQPAELTQDIELEDWIREHKVCSEVMPYHILDGHARIQVGFQLNLYARHLTSPQLQAGRCIECERVFAQLLRIAKSLQDCVRPVRLEVQPYDASFHYRPETNMKSEIQLSILILHRDHFLTVIDDDQKQCVRELEKRLRLMGVQSRTWSDVRALKASP